MKELDKVEKWTKMDELGRQNQIRFLKTEKIEKKMYKN